MCKPAEGESNRPSGLSLGMPCGESLLPTGPSGSKTPGQSSSASQTPNSSRLAAAYRLMKQWVEDALVLNVNPTVQHISKHQNEAAVVTSSVGGFSSTSKTQNRVENSGAPEVARSCCLSTPVSQTHSPDAVIPGCLSENYCKYNNGRPWQPSASNAASRYSSARPPEVERHVDLPSADADQGFSRPVVRPNLVPDYLSVGRNVVGLQSGNALSEQGEPTAPVEVASKNSTGTTLHIVADSAESAAGDYPGCDSMKIRCESSAYYWDSGEKSSHNADRTGNSEAGGAAYRQPSEPSSFLQYGSFRVRWGGVKTEPSSRGQPRGSSLCEDAVDCELSNTSECRASARQTCQPSDQQVMALDMPIPGRVGTEPATSGHTRTPGLQKTESLLWKMRDRLSSTLWCAQS